MTTTNTDRKPEPVEAIVSAWTATKHHDDSPTNPSIIEIKTSAFTHKGETEMHVNLFCRDHWITIWDENQLAELIAGLSQAGLQAGYNMSRVDPVLISVRGE